MQAPSCGLGTERANGCPACVLPMACRVVGIGRCALRHDAIVIKSLRQWTKVLERYEQMTNGRSVPPSAGRDPIHYPRTEN